MRVGRPSNGDLIAGVSVALVAIPQSLAYAELAGLPAQYGLYASALPSLIAAAFVSSKYLQTGPVALTALLTFGALSTMAEPFSTEYIQLAALLALLVGLTRTTLGLLRLGRVAYLLSEPVLTGFTTGAAILIVASQLPRVFDARSEDRGVLINAFLSMVRFDEWRWQAILFAAGSAAVMVAGRRVHRLFPGVLVAVVAAVIVSAATGYDGSVVGELEGGFVSLRLDFPWSSTIELLLPAVAIALVGFAEPASIARTFAAEERLTWDADREMLGQGVANLAAGFSGAFPVGGSFSRSSLNRLAGATSPWAGAVTGALVLFAIPLTPVLADLPTAVLGAIVIVAVVKLLKLADFRYLMLRSAPQGIVAVGTLAATLASAPRVERGVLVGIGLSLAVHLYRELDVTADSVRSGDVLTVAPKGVLWFATVPMVDRLIRDELAEHPDIGTVVIDFAGVGRLDFSGGAALGRLLVELRASGVRVLTANVPPGASRSAGLHLSDVADVSD